MGRETVEILETGAAALLFAATFVAGRRVRPFRRFIRNRQSVVSFGAGMSVAYVFVYLMPELHGARRAFAKSVPMALPYEGMGVYFLALVGFLVFYGISRAAARLHGPGDAERAGPAFKLEIGGFAAYVCVMAYLLLHNLEETPESILFYAAAIAFHFLAVDNALRHEHGAVYDRIGRFVLAGACVLGWSAGLLIALPPHTLALLIAFISGAIIMTSTIMELPTDADGRFVPFVAGGVVYGLILLPLG